MRFIIDLKAISLSHFFMNVQQSVQFSSVAQSCQTLQSHEPQHVSPPCPLPTPRVHPNPCPLSWWCHPTISSSVVPFSPCLNLSQHQGLFKWVSSPHQVAKVLEFQLQPSVLPMNIQDWFPLHGLVGSPGSPRDCRESSPTPQFKSINCSVLSFLYSLTLTSIHDYWKNYSLD